MIKTIIVDNEPKARKMLSELIKLHCPEINLAGVANSVKSAAELISGEKPDLVFLDIEMPHESGFELLKKFDNPDFEVIFTTAFDRYAIKAIKFNALDYLLKPINPEELQDSVRKAGTRLKSKNADNHQSYSALVSGSKRADKERQKILLPNIDGYTIVDMNQIISCEAEGNYTKIKLETRETLLISKTLKNFEDMLCRDEFFRIHNSTIINLNLVKKYVKGEGGYVIMKDNSTYEISRRKKNEFLEKISSI